MKDTAAESRKRLKAIKHQFASAFFDAGPGLAIFRAPGRVNLIGEHTDYNEGFVLPVAIDREAWIAVRPRKDGQVRIHSANLGRTAAFTLANLPEHGKGGWSSYPMGVAAKLQEAGYSLRGMDALVAGDVPMGAGMSSSAALEVAFALAFSNLGGLEIEGIDLVKLCQRAENEFVGVSCGIMDQFVSFFAKSDHALFLDCRSLQWSYPPLPERGLRIVVCDSGVKRGLASSEYNVRRGECEEGVRLLRQALPEIRSLRDVSPQIFEAHKHELPDRIRKRCEHVIYENGRVQRAVEALSAGRLSEVGELFYASHTSLKELYEVSCDELDVLIELASRQKGVFGSRLTGAGFGGCTVSLVQDDAVEAFKAGIGEAYRAKTGKAATIYVCRAVGGAGRVE